MSVRDPRFSMSLHEAEHVLFPRDDVGYPTGVTGEMPDSAML